MNPLREAAQQALEALKDYKRSDDDRVSIAMSILDAALAQQAEPAQEPVAICCNCLGTKRPHADDPEWKGRCDCEPPQLAEPAQEPVAWVASKDGRIIYDDASTDDGLLRVSGDFENDEQRISYAKQIVDKLNAAPAQQAEPVEPVAWNWMLDGLPYGLACYDDPPDADIAERAATAGRTVRLLYTAPPPPQRTMVPLTDEEIDAEWHELDGEASALFKRVIRKFARAVEKASEEKNNGQA